MATYSRRKSRESGEGGVVVAAKGNTFSSKTIWRELSGNVHATVTHVGIRMIKENTYRGARR